MSKAAEIGYLASQICHDIRNPLTTIGLASNISSHKIKNGKYDEEFVIDQLQKISSNVELMSATIDNYLSKIKHESGIEKEDFFVKDVLQEALEIVNPKIEKLPDVRVDMILDDEDILISAIRNDLLMSCVNLLSNALDAVSELDVKWIKIDVSEDKHYANIRITDSGSGIAKDLQEKIFESSFTTKARGSGLGLGFVKSVLDQYGASIKVDSDHPNTSFLIKFPI